MIKRRPLIILLIVILLITGLLWLYLSLMGPSTEVSVPVMTNPPPAAAAPKINGRRVLNLPADKTSLDDIKVSNSVSNDWREGVEKGLKAQGGDALKETKIEKVESLIWIQHGVALNVESLKITVTNSAGEKTSFRAMVDSQNGKILQTWDHPITDAVNPRDNPGIKIDPRYFQD